MHLFHVYVWPLIAVLAGNCAKGSGISGTNGYVEYFPGTPDSQVIITAAHGGYLKPSSIPDRTKGCLSGSACIWTHTCGSTSSQCTSKTVRDTKTKELATELTAALETQTGKRPHLIVNHLSRVKLDPNREIGEATFNVAAALTAFNEYHKFITDARANITGAGLLFDIHGQSHPEKWIELGYLMSKKRLNENNLEPTLSSIRSLYNSHSTNMNFDALLRGNNSFGGLLSNHGYQVVPSPGNTSPGSGNYFSGGYTVKTYGSRNGGAIDAIQIESPYALRTSERATYVAALTAVVQNFLDLYY